MLDFHVKHLQSHLTFCELAPSAMLSLRWGLKHFRQDFERHIEEKRCPYEAREAPVANG